MRRILYIPWSEHECGELKKTALAWKAIYAHSLNVAQNNRIGNAAGFLPAELDTGPSMFEIVCYDPEKQGQLRDLGKLAGVNVHQLYIMGYGKSDNACIFLSNAHDSPQLDQIDLILRLEHEQLPDEFNGKIRLWSFKNTISRKTPEAKPAHHDKNRVGGFGQLFADFVANFWQSAKVYANYKRLYASAKKDNLRRLKPGQFDVHFQNDGFYDIAPSAKKAPQKTCQAGSPRVLLFRPRQALVPRMH